MLVNAECIIIIFVNGEDDFITLIDVGPDILLPLKSNSDAIMLDDVDSDIVIMPVDGASDIMPLDGELDIMPGRMIQTSPCY